MNPAEERLKALKRILILKQKKMKLYLGRGLLIPCSSSDVHILFSAVFSMSKLIIV